MWSYNSIEYQNNSNKTLQLSIVSHLPDAIKFPQTISLKPSFMIRGNGSLGNWSRKTSHSYSRRHNDDDKSSGEEGLEVSLGEESCGLGTLDTRHTFSSN